MSGIVTLEGSLSGGPPLAVADEFAGAQFATQLRLSVSPKSYTNASGILARTFTNPSVYVTLGVVGADREVPKANFLYFRAPGDFGLRITQDDGLGGSVVHTSQHTGLYLAEFPASKLVTQVEIAANGQVEYFASGT